MKSLRQLRSDLLNVRLQATSINLWSIDATIIERANRAINDAIATYEITIHGVYTSLAVPTIPTAVAIPKDIGRIYSIRSVDRTGVGSRELRDFRQVLTAETNLLYMDEGVRVWGAVANWLPVGNLEVYYESLQRELPSDIVVIGATLATDGQALSVSGGSPAAVWPSPGHFELSIPFAGTDIREVIHYEVALPSGFSGLRRGVEGMIWQWTQGALVSAIYEAPDKSLPIVMAKGQATMYEFWVRNRAFYDQYTGIASEQALGVQDLVALARSYEDKADRMFNRIKSPPAPGRTKVRIRRP